MVRKIVVNKVADDGFKPGWNELLHMLEQRSQRYKILKPNEVHSLGFFS